MCAGIPRRSNTVLLTEDNQVQTKVIVMSKRSDQQALSIHLLFLSFFGYWLCNPAKSAAFLFRNNAMRHETTHHLSRKTISCLADMITNDNVEFLDLKILSSLRRKTKPLKLFFEQKISSLIERQYLDRIRYEP
jgi:hypothetical protein